MSNEVMKLLEIAKMQVSPRTAGVFIDQALVLLRAKPAAVSEADIVVDLSGGKLLIQKLRAELKAKDEELEAKELENNKLLDTCIAAGFIGKGTQIVGDKRYKELVAAEKEFKRISVAFVNSEETKTKLKKYIEQLEAKLKAKDEEIEKLEGIIREISRISCGEDQVAEDDSEGMGVIYHITEQALKKTL